MISPFAAEGIWIPLDHDVAWAPFERFHFEANYYETQQPAIALPEDALVVDLAPVFTDEGAMFAAGEAAINASALRAFVSLAGDLEMTALDWQHTPYRYSPAKHALANIEAWPVPVFPNGDYYIHLGPDAAWGPARQARQRRVVCSHYWRRLQPGRVSRATGRLHTSLGSRRSRRMVPRRGLGTGRSRRPLLPRSGRSTGGEVTHRHQRIQ